jgi:hypothetical protein
VDLGLVGLANAGKTALFNLITGAEATVAPYPYSTSEAERAMADVPDPRIDAIADVQDIPRRVPAQVQMVDIPGLAAGAGGGEGIGGRELGRLREMDALVHVLRGFANPDVPHPTGAVDPLADAEAVDLELIVADREQVARRAERAAKQARSGEAAARAEITALEALASALDDGRPARSVGDPAARALAIEMGLLSAKPVLYVVNTDEPGDAPPEVAEYARTVGAHAMALAVGLELELAAMAPEEAAALAEELDLGELRGSDAVVQAGYRLLDLITFFTGSGPPEARAWAIARGATADRAAGRIHSDMERGFIRAEVIRWDELVAAGSFARARERALLRVEGRDYVVQEGDVMQIRFNV